MSSAKVRVEDSVQTLADSLRAKSGVDYASAKLEVQGRHGAESNWMEYVRGKDLLKYLTDKPELTAAFERQQGRTAEEAAADVITLLLRRKLLLRCERKYRKPKPGKKKLVKWPRTLELAEEPQTWSEESFYAWTYDRPTTAWFYIGSGLLVLAVLGFTLFPLAPYMVRLAVLYFLVTLLSTLLGLIAVRYLLFVAVWLAAGHHFWLMPNLMSESLPITELFSPLTSFAPKSGGRSMVLARAGTAVLLAALVYGLATYSPDAETVKEQMKGASNDFMAYLDAMATGNKGLTDTRNATASANATFNGTAGNSNPAGSGAAGGDKQGQQGSTEL